MIYIIRDRAAKQQITEIRPRQNNRSLEIQDPAIREKVARVTRNLSGGV
ncbi:MAG: DUF5674 family protein [bacterium]